MSRLDHHIRNVRAKLSLGIFIDAWAIALLVAAVVLLLYALVRQFTSIVLPQEWIGLLLLILTSVAYAAWRTAKRRPDELAVAVAIDERLGLQEKISTALHARRTNDPFSQAALLDAEQTAGGVDLHRKFPIHWPRTLWPMVVIALLAASLLGLVRPRNLFASNTPGAATVDAQAEARAGAKENVKQAIAAIEQAPKVINQKPPLQLAKAELEDLLKKPDFDPAGANRKALSAMQQLEKEIATQKDDPLTYEARRTEQQMAAMKPDAKEPGPVADAHRELSKGNFDAAGEKLSDAVKQFDKMSPEEKAAAAKQMRQLADGLQKAANDPQQQQRTQQQMQQLGMNPQQQQKAQQLMKEAAKGDAKSAQQLKELAKQSVQQLNNGQPPTPQQQQQAEQLAKQMQAQAQSQQQKEQLQQDAQKLADTMQQSAAMPKSPSDSQSKDPDAPQGQQQAKGSGKSSDKQQQSKDMQDAMADAQQQMQKMQASSQNAKQTAQSEQGAQQAAANAQSAMNDTPPPGGTPSNTATTGGPPGSSYGKGHGAALSDKEFAPLQASIRKAVSDSDNTDPDHVLASSLIKGDSPRGESHAPLQAVTKAAAQQAAEEVDSEHVGREGKKVVRDYFGALGEGK